MLMINISEPYEYRSADSESDKNTHREPAACRDLRNRIRTMPGLDRKPARCEILIIIELD